MQRYRYSHDFKDNTEFTNQETVVVLQTQQLEKAFYPDNRKKPTQHHTLYKANEERHKLTSCRKLIMRDRDANLEVHNSQDA